MWYLADIRTPIATQQRWRKRLNPGRLLHLSEKEKTDHRVHVFHKTWNYFAVHTELWTAMRLNFRTVKVMLYETIRRNTALQCWNNVATLWNNIATMLQRRVTACAKNRGCEFEWTFEFSTSRKFVLLTFWLSLRCLCLDIVNFLLSAKCKTGCYFLPILNQPQGVAKQCVRGEGSNRGEKIEKCVEM